MKMRIAEIRTAKGINQEVVAEAAGIRTATLSDLENNKSNPRLSTLEAIAAALGVHVLDLFEPETRDPVEQELIDGVRSADPQTRHALIAILGLRKT